MDEFLEAIDESEMQALKDFCAELVSCNCESCRFWITERDDPHIPQSHQFTALICELGRMGNADRITGDVMCGALYLLSEAIEAKSDEVIAFVNKTAEDTMRSAMTAHERN